ncbi:TPA: hypothetical protein CPT92_07065 [Candidatus Gastranaerophilales bacterium HUM_13]|jgi:hypothetical protein|nr:MAG TPA: hypothetical protein CPT92_07065 [Candidatus Gastranaerophilales bacterium HUM_13]
MTNFEKLNKRKTYIGLQYGTSLIAKKIRKYSKSYAPNSKEIPTHVFALVFRLGEWWVYESHAKGFKKLGIPEGVRRYTIDKWLEIEKKTQEEFKLYPLKLNFKTLEKNIGFPYGTGDIESLLRAAIFHRNGKQKDRPGLICSEYIALCSEDIQKFCNLPAWCITPAHFQHYIDTKGIKAEGRENEN